MKIAADIIKQLLQPNIQWYRKIVQYLFLATVVLIGIKFSIFVNQLANGISPTVTRPPGIEAFLPISSLISLKYWLVSGIFNQVHPSGLIILLMALATGLLLKRGFCSWICPFGLLTEYLNRLHRLIFRKNVKLPAWLDYPLRSLKYLLLGFFLWAIALQMDAVELEYFIYSPYNMVADIKMLYFFQNVTALAFRVLVVLLVLSVLIRNFWCRYLCPYGALLGILSFLSILKIHRNAETCTNCQKCTRTCPVDIAIDCAGQEVKGVETILAFDPILLNLDAVTPGPWFSGTGLDYYFFDYTAIEPQGTIHFASSVLDGSNNQSLTIAVCHFTALGFGTTPLIFQDVDVRGPNNLDLGFGHSTGDLVHIDQAVPVTTTSYGRLKALFR